MYVCKHVYAYIGNIYVFMYTHVYIHVYMYVYAYREKNQGKCSGQQRFCSPQLVLSRYDVLASLLRVSTCVEVCCSVV